MRRNHLARLLALALLAAAPVVRAEEPPALETALTRLAPGEIHPAIEAVPDPTQTYALYLPKSFDPAKKWPLLLVFDPRSRGPFAARIFEPAAEKWGWIVASSNDTMSDGPWEPNVRAVNAMVPDLLERLPIDERRVYATGFSGGAMLSWAFGQGPIDLAGVISVGGRPFGTFTDAPPQFAFWGAAGTTDFNYVPTLQLDRLAAKGARLHRFEPFEGPHSWFSSDDAERALAWMEVVAMQEGRRPKDADVAVSLYARELERIDALVEAGRQLDAWRTAAAATATYGGIVDVAQAKRRAEALDRSAEVKAQRKDEAWGERYEERVIRNVEAGMRALRSSDGPPNHHQITKAIDLAQLHDNAELPGLRGESGRRGIAIAYVQFAFYEPRQLMVEKDLLRAKAALETALEIRPNGDPFVWHRLAQAQVALGSDDAALESLGKAIETGHPFAAQILRDPAFEALHQRPEFVALESRAGGSDAG